MIEIKLTVPEAKILAVLLDMAGDQFGSHGCNDFHLIKDGGLSPGEAQELIAQLQVNHPGEEDGFDREQQYDWMLLGHFLKVVRKQLDAFKTVS